MDALDVLTITKVISCQRARMPKGRAETHDTVDRHGTRKDDVCKRGMQSRGQGRDAARKRAGAEFRRTAREGAAQLARGPQPAARHITRLLQRRRQARRHWIRIRGRRLGKRERPAEAGEASGGGGIDSEAWPADAGRIMQLC